MYARICLSMIALGLTAAPGIAQSRFETQAQERAAQHARDAAVRAAENPEPVSPTAEAASAAVPEPAPVPIAPEPGR
jgi:hypothetical protein